MYPHDTHFKQSDIIPDVFFLYLEKLFCIGIIIVIIEHNGVRDYLHWFI